MRTLKRRRWASQCWITCVLDFKERHRAAMMMPRRYTELFFLDEATALAAGHRPCAECRRSDFVRYATIWNGIRGKPGRAYVRDMDPLLHDQRLVSAPDANRHFVVPSEQPDGTFVETDGAPILIWQGRLFRWTFDGYADAGSVSKVSLASLVTPLASRDILGAGYTPQVHPTAMTEP